MEDIVAIKANYEDGTHRYFLTWGRIQDPLDPKPVESLVAMRAKRRSGSPLVSCQICDSLQEASHAKYFYECLFTICQKRIPFGDEHDAWVLERDAAMNDGREIWDCG